MRPSAEDDVAKVAVVARHGINRNIGLGFVKGFGLRKGAIASSVGHDSHNLSVVRMDDSDMAAAINRLGRDPDLRAKMGKKGRERVLEHFSWDAIAETTLELYRTLR